MTRKSISRRSMSAICLGFLCSLSPHFSGGKAFAAWSGWEGVPGAVIMGEPSCVYEETSRIRCFARGADNNLRHASFDGGAWSIWTSLPGGPTGGVEQPSCIKPDITTIACFARGADGRMWQLLWHISDRREGTWHNLGGVIMDRPSCVSRGTGRIDCFVRGTDNAMWHRMWDGTWHNWETLGGRIMDGPSCVTWGPPPQADPLTIHCFARGTGNAMWHKSLVWGIWGDWAKRPGLADFVLMERPSCFAASPPNRIDCFARGADNALWRAYLQWDGWYGWNSLGGVIMEGPSCLVWAEDPVAIDCFARGTDNAMWQYHKWAWQTRGPGVIMGQPTCISLGRNAVDCFAHGIDNGMLHNQWR
jgi:hypothetical protein